MKEWEITWVKRGTEPPTEGEFIPMPDYCHHGRYVSGMMVREIMPGKDWVTRGVLDENARNRCPFCGQPDYKIHDQGGSLKTHCCNQTVSGCCGDGDPIG